MLNFCFLDDVDSSVRVTISYSNAVPVRRSDSGSFIADSEAVCGPDSSVGASHSETLRTHPWADNVPDCKSDVTSDVVSDSSDSEAHVCAYRLSRRELLVGGRILSPVSSGSRVVIRVQQLLYLSGRSVLYGRNPL